ncbi:MULTISPECIES: TIGR03943 family protein [unclassified Clostridium]|uniref:TIGR03943 family putative permease subunit n=1 Tax=unclassified Clostridium TaxID=2614128 RepID=UPI000297E94E|nr:MULTISPECIES: TIGR03943 family protein [unclassified Clostridium]EKQ57233.1 MAG: TIGR03943 family protein [Clostridium sp. Maddingley MBC34-26]
MKKLNLDIVIKILILLVFSAFYFRIIRNNEIIMYVHPRMIPFVIFGMISMFIIALFLIPDSFRNKKKKIKLKNYIIFIFPLIMIFFMQNTNTNSAVTTGDVNINSNTSSNTDSSKSSNISPNQNNDLKSTLLANSTYELYSGKTESDGQGIQDKNQLDIENNIIQINLKNFVPSLDVILGNPDKYIGKEIEMSGFVYKGKDLDLKGNEFILSRFMMVCCAADLQVAGIECDSNNLGSYDNGTWIKVKGKIKTDTSGDEVDPIIVAEQIEKDPNPDTSYVYPF